MEIDARLIKFNRDISPNINSMIGESKSLIQKLNSFCSITDNAKDAFDTSFKTDGADAIKEKMSYLNVSAKNISNSIFNDLDVVLDKCRKLSFGINDLEALLDEYNVVNSKSDQNEANNFEIKFLDMQEELLKLYNEIENTDLELGHFSNEKEGISLRSFSNLKNNDYSLLYEKDGSIYQKSMPIFRGKRYNLDDSLNIIYDNKKILLADKEAGLLVVNYLKEIMNNGYGNDKYSLWDYQKSKYSNSDGIAKVMNRILEDSYEGNKCSSLGEFAAVAATVLSQGPVNLRYGYNIDNSWNSIGFANILSEGSLSNSEFVSWCYTQGLCKKSEKVELKEDSISNIFMEFSKETYGMTLEDLSKLEIGSCLSKSSNGRDKVLFGMVIGYTKINEDPAVVIAQALSNKSGSYCNIYKIKDCFGNGDNKWQRYVPASVIENIIMRG